MYVHRRTLVAVADRFLGVGCSLITSLVGRMGPQSTYTPRVPQCLSPSLELGPPHSLSASECVPYPWTKGGGGGCTLACGWRGGTVPIPTRGQTLWGNPNSDDWRKGLALCLLCGLTLPSTHYYIILLSVRIIFIPISVFHHFLHSLPNPSQGENIWRVSHLWQDKTNKICIRQVTL